MTKQLFYTDLKSLCPDLKSQPQFVIFLPRFEIPEANPICNSSCPNSKSIKSAPICNPLIAPFCNPENFFPFWYWNLNMNNFWFRDPNLMNLVWDAFGMIAKNDLGFNPYHWWRHYLVLFWCWNLDMDNSWLSRSILMKLCQRKLWYDS